MLAVVPGFFSGIGPMEILVILVIAVVLFGNKLPEVAKTLGKGYMEFRRGLKVLEGQIDFDAEPPRTNTQPRALLPTEVAPAAQEQNPVAKEETPPAAGGQGEVEATGPGEPDDGADKEEGRG